jgi:hypothetical protein
MTRKLTDEQVKAIRKMSYGSTITLPLTDKLDIKIYKDYKMISGIDYWRIQKLFNSKIGYSEKYIEFKTPDEAIAYAEHLLNQRYCWLPQQQSWIMSGEVYNFANNGANKVLELMYLAEQNGFSFTSNDWYSSDGISCNGIPPCLFYSDYGITIPPDSPIWDWDAVKGIE